VSTLSGAKVLITGGAGFIGSELSRQVAAAGAETIIVDNLANGKSENVETILNERCRLERVDIRDGAKMAALIKGVNVVYHLACLGVRHSIHAPSENHHVNATATLELLAAARAAGVERFVYVSSSEVYGTAKWVPQTEDHPTDPCTVYGGSKLAGECYTRAYHRTYGYPTVVIRPFNTYGPRSHHEGDCGEVIPKFMLRCMANKPLVIFGDGTQTRDFTFVSDTARGILSAGTAPGVVGQTVNIGQETEIQVKDLALLVARACGVSARIQHDDPRPGDVLRLFASATKARELLNFKPEVSMADGLKELHAYYKGLGVSPESLLDAERVRNWVAP
jgi:UDP-glucose 4-epimerase